MAGLTEIIYKGSFIGPDFLKLYNRMLLEKVFMNLRLQIYTEWIYSRGIEIPEDNLKR